MAPGLLDLVHLTTWAVCAVIKLPQLVAVLRAGSAWGLSVSSLLLELAGLLVFLRYQIYYGYPLETYLEFPVVIAQDVILLSCIMHFSGKVRRACFYALVYWVGWYMITLQKWIIDLAMNLCTLISAASKLVQLQHLWETKDAGQASALTWGMSVYASAEFMNSHLWSSCGNSPVVCMNSSTAVCQKCLLHLHKTHLKYSHNKTYHPVMLDLFLHEKKPVITSCGEQQQ
ncbi:solute carrier family 66 member 3 isoform X1 [Agelaius tricolor]|uniref:solute carrier family 66 member 3 isoform X1 n=1 Tax=Agelaius phoeniceus TaxID=39638 RepID=UPI0023EB891B|nr:solute carrier family 66 member 3 isoform X1 [Agelaius phoeniceus]